MTSVNPCFEQRPEMEFITHTMNRPPPLSSPSSPEPNRRLNSAMVIFLLYLFQETDWLTTDLGNLLETILLL